MKLQKVIWTDIAGGGEWMSSAEAVVWGKKMFNVNYETTGYIIHRGVKFLIIAATYDPDEKKFHDISMIPRAVIKRIENI